MTWSSPQGTGDDGSGTARPARPLVVHFVPPHCTSDGRRQTKQEFCRPVGNCLTVVLPQASTQQQSKRCPIKQQVLQGVAPPANSDFRHRLSTGLSPMTVDNSSAGSPDKSSRAMSNHQLAFSMRGIDRGTGCMVVVLRGPSAAAGRPPRPGGQLRRLPAGVGLMPAVATGRRARSSRASMTGVLTRPSSWWPASPPAPARFSRVATHRCG